MNASESKGLKKGNRVYWRGDANDGGIITEMSWDAVTIAWDNGHVAAVHHGDMREIASASKAYYCVGTVSVGPRGVCPLLDQSRQRRILAGDGLSVNDPKRTLTITINAFDAV